MIRGASGMNDRLKSLRTLPKQFSLDTMNCQHCDWPILDSKGRVNLGEGYSAEAFVCTNCTYIFSVVRNATGLVGWNELVDDPEAGGSFLE